MHLIVLIPAKEFSVRQDLRLFQVFEAAASQHGYHRRPPLFKTIMYIQVAQTLAAQSPQILPACHAHMLPFFLYNCMSNKIIPLSVTCISGNRAVHIYPLRILVFSCNIAQGRRRSLSSINPPAKYRKTMSYCPSGSVF